MRRPEINVLASALDWLGLKAAILAIVGVVVAITLIVGSTVHRATDETVIRHEQQVRDGYAALSDLHRLANVLLRVKRIGNLSEELRPMLINANDMLWVRADDLRIRNAEAIENQDLQRFAGALFGVVETVESFMEIASSVGLDPLALERLDAIIDSADQARAATIQYIDSMRRAHDLLITQQSGALRGQNALLVSLAGGLTVAGIFLFYLLRREILLRNAREKAESRAMFLAYHDALTGLPNRSRFIDIVTPLLSKERHGCIWMIDFDRFKALNDSLGHDAGDTALKEISARISATLAECDGVLCRISGDEFAAFVPMEGVDAQRFLADTVIEASAEPIEYAANQIQLGISIGIAPISSKLPLEADLDTLLRYADFALYVAKSDGRGRCALFDAELNEKYVQRHDMLEKLRTDLQLGRLDVYLQPKVSLDSGQVYAFEALARWSYQVARVPPTVFIELAEEAGLVGQIDNLILRKAVTEVRRLNRRHGSRFGVAVNLSGLHFKDDAILREIRGILEETGHPAELLTLEITETVQLQDWERVTSLLGQFRKIGCKVSIDDFGTGYSSLSYIERIKADELKIDKSLIDTLETSSKTQFLLKSVIEYAQDHLGMAVICEGIESMSQARAVQNIGGSLGQGYYFGHPMPADDAFEEALERSAQKSRIEKFVRTSEI